MSPQPLHTPIRRTKIVATLGPASDREGVLEAMIRTGVDVVRLNFSHGTAADHRRRLIAVRQVPDRLGRSAAALGALQGPRTRTDRPPAGPGSTHANGSPSSPPPFASSVSVNPRAYSPRATRSRTVALPGSTATRIERSPAK